MRITRKTEVVVQTHQLTTVHLTRASVSAWCAPCRADVLVLMPDEAAALAQCTARDIYSRVEAGEFHSIETDAGDLRVCVNSLNGTTPGSKTQLSEPGAVATALNLSAKSNFRRRKLYAKTREKKPAN